VKRRRARRQFTREFKEQAVKLVLEHGKSQSDVGRDLDVHGSVIGHWVKQALANAGKAHEAAQEGQRAGDRENNSKKSSGLLREGERMRFSFIDAEKASMTPAGNVTQLCRALKVSRSGYYAWCTRRPSERARADALLAVKVAEAFEMSNKRYGSPRVQDALKTEGIRTSRKRVIRLMQEQGLVGRPKRMFVVTTDSEHKLEVAPNLLKQDFKATAPNQRWVGDITYLRTPEGWLYLAVIIDLYSRYVVGWAVSPIIDGHLVVAALEMALKRRGGGAELFHSDRGSQYASDDYQKALVAAALTASMSRKGNCYDNAVAESWFSTLHFELGKRFASHAAAQEQLFEFITATSSASPSRR
jgi:transposase InsO family protein/transposase-like protein